MSDFEVRIHHLFVEPHPNADALEIAVVGGLEQCLDASGCAGCSCGREDVGPHCSEHIRTIVGGFRAVVPKGTYKTGDYALYIPEQAVLPDPLIEELGLTGRLSGSGKNRVKAIRLRGELSQGIVCRPVGTNLAWEWLTWEYLDPEIVPALLEEDYGQMLGIVRWQPRVPDSMRGRIREHGDSRILGWVEINNIKKHMDMFSPGEIVHVTEKIHGTCFLATFDSENDTFLVSSKGIAKQGWDLVEEAENVYWKAARKYYIEEFLRWIWEYTPTVKRIALYGEIYGAGIQDMSYMQQENTLAVFDIRMDDRWCNPLDVHTLVTASRIAEFNIPMVPLLYMGPYDYDKICQIAEGMTVAGAGAHIREGVVVRPKEEGFYKDSSRRIAKFINPAYLLRQNGTEFE